MTAEELIKEGRRISRPSVYLKDQGSGPMAALWYPWDYEEYNRTRVRCWLTVDAAYVPGSSASDPTFISVYSHERRPDDGRVELLQSWPEQEGIRLFAHTVSPLPPVDAVFALGSPAIDEWLGSHGRKRTDNFLSSLEDEAIRGYERVWQAESPYFAEDVYAVLGGWHMPWPEGDFNELLCDTMLIWTLKDPEPWVEVWRRASGEFRVLQRIT